MASKTHLVLAFFPNERAADDTAAVFKEWVKSNPWVDLEAIGVLVKDEHGNVKTHKLGPREGARGIGVGAVLGIIAAVPTGGLSLVEGAAVGGAGGGVVGSLFHRGLGLSGRDAARIAGRLEAGQAALGVLVPPQQAAAISGELARLGGAAEIHEVSEDAVQEATTTAR
jgi:uncharacterized membrane protein